jgi:hypothetical protein
MAGYGRAVPVMSMVVVCRFGSVKREDGALPPAWHFGLLDCGIAVWVRALGAMVMNLRLWVWGS